MSKEMNAKVGQLRTFFKKNQPKSHPITDHPISACEEYARGLYFDMLCVMAQYENDDTENQFRFIQRIMAACEEFMPIAEHSKRAMELSADKVTEFLKQCKDNKLEAIFFIDSLLISCANGAPNAKQVEFLAEIGDVMGFDKAKMQYLSELAVSILEQDSERYQAVNKGYEEAEKDEVLKSILCYTKEFVSGWLIDTPKYCHLYSPKLPDEPLEGGNKLLNDLDTVIIENQLLINFRFESIKTVILRNCRIEKVGLNFTAIQKIIIENCCFDINEEKPKNYCSNRAITINTTNCNFSVKKCSFFNCHSFVPNGYYNKGPFFGSVICFRKSNVRSNNQIMLEDCDFRNNSIRWEHHSCDLRGIILYSDDPSDSISIKNSCFYNCTAEYCANRTDTGLFRSAGKLEIENNTYIQCNPER